MNKFKMIDELFRDRLKDQQKDPPDHIWLRISENNLFPDDIANKKPTGNNKKQIFYIGVILVSVLFYSSLLIYFNLFDYKSGATKCDKIYQDSIKNIHQKKKNDYFALHNLEKKHDGINKVKKNTGDFLKYSKTEVKSALDGNIDLTIKLSDAFFQTKIDLKEDSFSGIPDYVIHNELPDLIDKFSFEIQDIKLNDEFSYIEDKIIKPPISNRFFNDSKLAVGLVYGAEYYSTNVLKNNNWMKSKDIGVNVQFKHKNCLSLASGFLFSSYSNAAILDIQHLVIDTIGFFEEVNSLSFQPIYDPIDSTIIGYVPTNMTTNTYPIIDTSENNMFIEFPQRQIYFNIPIIIGFDVLTFPKGAVSVNAGLIYNRVIWRSSIAPKMPDDLIVTDINKISIERNKHFLQYKFGLGFRYSLSRKFHFWLNGSLRKTPHQNMFFNQQSKNTRNLSFGIQTGIFFNLKNNSMNQ